MSSSSLLRIAARAQPSTFFRANGLRSLTPRSSNALYAVPALIATSGSVSSFSTSSVRLSDKDGQEASHHEESFEEFTARYVDPQLASRAFEHVQHSRNEAMMHASTDRQSLTFWCQRIDMRRNSTRSKMSSNFRYDTYCFRLYPRLASRTSRLLIIIRWSTAKPQQCVRIRSRPFTFRPHCCVEGSAKSQRLSYSCANL